MLGIRDPCLQTFPQAAGFDWFAGQVAPGPPSFGRRPRVDERLYGHYNWPALSRTGASPWDRSCQIFAWSGENGLTVDLKRRSSWPQR